MAMAVRMAVRMGMAWIPIILGVSVALLTVTSPSFAEAFVVPLLPNHPRQGRYKSIHVNPNINVNINTNADSFRGSNRNRNRIVFAPHPSHNCYSHWRPRNRLGLGNAPTENGGDGGGDEDADAECLQAAARSLHGRLLCASQCAYATVPELQGTANPYFRGAGYLPGTSVKRIRTWNGLDACLIGRTQDGIVVAFRGTTSALQWLQNASIFLRKVPERLAPPGCRVHEGFYAALMGRFGPRLGKAVRKAIREFLADEEDEQEANATKIFVTGHSKGGSLASLFALMVHNDERISAPVELVCTFGAAKVGNPAFCAYYDAKIHQVTYENDRDLIPFLPPGKDTMVNIQETEDPEKMMEMIDDLLGPKNKKNRIRNNDFGWNYNPVGQRIYIDPQGRLNANVTQALDVQRLSDLETASIRDLRRAHCSSCSDPEESDGEFLLNDKENIEGDTTTTPTGSSESSTCGGFYFSALAPEICDRLSDAGECL